MLRRLLHRTPPRPSLALGDVDKFISDPDDAMAAYWDLRHLEKLGVAKVYVPASADFWNVWLEPKLTAPRTPHGERLTLEAWCARWQTREDGWRQWIADAFDGKGVER